MANKKINGIVKITSPAKNTTITNVPDQQKRSSSALPGPGLGTSVLAGINLQPVQQEDDSYYDEFIAQLEQQQANRTQAIRDAANASIAQLDAQKPVIERNYQNAQKQAYIQNALNQSQMSDRLSAMGYSGGMSESTMASMNNEYMNNRADATADRDQSLNDLEGRKASIYADMNSNIANAEDSYFSDYMNIMNQKRQDDAAKKEKQETEKKAAEAAAWNNQANREIARLQEQGYSLNTWTDEATGKLYYAVTGNDKNTQKEIDKWNNSQQVKIANAKKKGYDIYTWEDSAGKIHYKIIGSGTSGSSGGSSGKTGGSSGGSGGTYRSYSGVPAASTGNTGSSSGKTTYSAEYKRLSTNIGNYMLKGNATEKQLDNFTNQIESAYRSGKISEKEANKLLKTLR